MEIERVTNPPTFSIIGTGFIAPRHIQSIYTVGGKIIDVVNTAYGLSHWRTVIENTSARYIVILTPNDLHMPMSYCAAEAGKEVLCEKPATIRVGDAVRLCALRNVYTVLQLRYHPLVEKIKQAIQYREYNYITMNISVYRDERYCNSWKGDSARSGGILFNLGIHYFDMLLHLFGPATVVSLGKSDGKTAQGAVEGENYFCHWTVSTAAPRDKQQRAFFINGIDYNFSSADNLSYENLHKYVYEALLNGNCHTIQDALPAIELIERIYDSV
jgi:UDP-N-acetyl-2-amino-2-deoxyglucuronate dehydrogenase